MEFYLGYYLYVDMNAKNSQILDKAMLRSPVYAPPPFYHQDTSSNYYNSCQVGSPYTDVKDEIIFISNEKILGIYENRTFL